MCGRGTEVAACIELRNGEELCDEVPEEVATNVLGSGLDDREVEVEGHWETPLRVPVGAVTGATGCANNDGGDTGLVV